MNYQDTWSRYHDKPTDGSPSSNNGYIYSSYAHRLGLPLDFTKLTLCFEQCLVDGKFVRRSPSKFNGPFVSRDECLGAVALGLLKPEHLNKWNFSPFALPKLNIIKLVQQLWECRNKHRNYFWKNNLTQVYRVAYMVPLQDRHFILKTWDKFQWYNPIHQFYRLIAKVDSMLPKKSGIKWLKYGGEENKMEMVKEFTMDHPIRMKVLGEI